MLHFFLKIVLYYIYILNGHCKWEYTINIIYLKKIMFNFFILLLHYIKTIEQFETLESLIKLTKGSKKPKQ